MRETDHRNLIGGTIVTIAGLTVTAYAMTQLDMGSLRRMGPGFFPAVLGILLAGLGAVTVLIGLLEHGRPARLEVGPALSVLGGLGVFALTVDRFGLLIAVPALVLVSAMASRKRPLVPMIVLTAALCVLTWAIFLVGFNLPIDLLKWNP